MVRIRARLSSLYSRRTLVRCCAAAAATLLLAAVLPWPEAVLIVPAMSPFTTIATVLATRAVGAATLVGLPVLAVVLLRRRWFCRWLCPVGLMTECASGLSPASPSRCRGVPPIGKGIVLFCTAAAGFGFPALLWLDPLALFCGLFSLAYDPLRWAGYVAAGAMGGLLVLSVVLPGAWCLRLCPLGATQELLAMPWQLLHAGRMTAATTGGHGDEHLPWPARRSVLAFGLGAVCVGLGMPFGVIGRARGAIRPASMLRPPGAAPRWQFPQLCIRCGNCARGCPSGIIHLDWHPVKAGDWLTPIVSFESDYCREDCNDCLQVCPSGAIARGDVAAKHERPIGLAEIDLSRCLLAADRECHAMCLEQCPYEAITMHEWTWEDDRRYPIIEATKCPGCGACVVACSPMDAITVVAPD